MKSVMKKIVTISLLSVMILSGCSTNTSVQSEVAESSVSESTEIESSQESVVSLVSEISEFSDTSLDSSDESSISESSVVTSQASEISKAETSKESSLEEVSEKENSKAEESSNSQTSKQTTALESSSQTNNASSSTVSETSKPSANSTTTTSQPSQTSTVQKSTNTATPTRIQCLSNANVMEGEKMTVTVCVYPKNANCDSVKLTSPDGSFTILNKEVRDTLEGDNAVFIDFTVKAKATKETLTTKLVATANGNLSDEQEVYIISKTKDSEYAAYYTPYDIDAIVAEIRAYGESRGGIWTEGFYVKNGGLDYGNTDDPTDACGFFFPHRTTDSYDGKRQHDDIFYAFEELEDYMSSDTTQLNGVRFKVVVLYNGYSEYDQKEEYEIYLVYG